MPRRISALAAILFFALAAVLWAAPSFAQEDLPWQRGYQRQIPPDDAYPPSQPRYEPVRPDPYGQKGYGTTQVQPKDDAYHPPKRYVPPYGEQYGSQPGGYAQTPPGSTYQPYSGQQPYPGKPYPGQQPYAGTPGGYQQPYSGYGQPYTAVPEGEEEYDRRYDPKPYVERPPNDTYSSNEIMQAGHNFFGSVSKGLASVVEYAFQQQGRPNGYILGQDAGGAFVAGLRYGEGLLYTKDAGTHRVYWQGPSIGWDAGAEGSKVMVLVYNLTSPEEIYQRFGGVNGSAYLVGGVGLTFQKSGDVVVAPIRAGVGLRLGANVGYLKYTRAPTWNPF